jgi:putative spermidine/putrescine transport system permease protein
MTGRPPRFLWPFVIVVYVLLLAPLVVVISVSFGSTPTFDFPPKGLTLRWYHAFFASEMLVRSFFRVSQVVGLLTALVATVIGSLAAIGLVRLHFRGRDAIETFFLSPLLVPHILLGAAVYLYLARLAWATSSMTLLVGHIVIATPYVIRCVTAGLVGMDPRLEEAAMSLGASRPQAFIKVTLPLLRSSLVTGAIFAFNHLVQRHQPRALPCGPQRPQPTRSDFFADPVRGRPVDRRCIGPADRHRRWAYHSGAASVPAAADGLTQSARRTQCPNSQSACRS